VRNTKSVGDVSEAMFTAKFLQLGWVVLKPFGDNERYDLVIDRGQGFERVQVKTGNYKNGVVKFNASTVGKNYKNIDYRGQCELFAVYCTALHKFYLIRVDEVCTSKPHLRVEPTKSNQAV